MMAKQSTKLFDCCLLTMLMLALSAPSFAEETTSTSELKGSLAVTDVTLISELQEDPEERIAEGINFWVTGFDNGTSHLSSKLLGGKDPSAIEKPFSTYPTMLYEVLPFEWDLVPTIPLMNIKHELPNEPMHSGHSITQLINVFNVLVLTSPELDYQLPDSADLIIELKSPDQVLEFQVQMKLDQGQGSYSIVDPQAFVSRLGLEIEELNRNQRHPTIRPTLTLREMRGFEFSEETVSNF